MRNHLPHAILLMPICAGLADAPSPAAKPRQPGEYRSFAMAHQGDVERGRKLFLEDQRLACGKCHTTNGKGGKAGPDLFAIGDKFGRRDLIDSVLSPSTTIAVGYSTTVVKTKSGE